MIAIILGVFILGLIIGGAIAVTISRRRSIGDLIVDNSDVYDGPYLFLELRTTLNAISSKKYVTMRVNVKNYISQK